MLSAARLYLLLKIIVSVLLSSSAELIIVHQANGRAKAPVVSDKIQSARVGLCRTFIFCCFPSYVGRGLF